MEFKFEDSINKFDCLLDNLMESDIIVDDVNLGFKDETELSPSHSTDSGYGETMTSPSHSVSSTEDAISLSDEQMQLFPDSLDQEITGYLSRDNSNDSVDIVSIAAQALHTPPLHDFVECDQTSEQETALTLRPISPAEIPRRKTRRSSKSQTASEFKTKVKQELGKENQTTVSVSSKLPPIKVIKVIKTSDTSSMEETQEQIYEAMEERSRKNAIQAKMNREKKKAYIKSLEDDVEQLKKENKTLKVNNEKLQKSYKTMEEELEYFRSVLANQSALSSLLKNIPQVKNVQLSSSFSRKRKSIESDHDYPLPKKIADSAGVCLHVHQDKVSLEFCAKCSSAASVNGEIQWKLVIIESSEYTTCPRVHKPTPGWLLGN